jgi:hypothetical protein
MRFSTRLALALAITIATAAPVPAAQTGPSYGAGGGGITAAQLLTVMPTSSTCTETVECRTAARAAPWVSKSFLDYGISSKAEQAALLGIMAFESVEFKYNTNQAGHVGQGTRNMQSAEFNLKYAQSIPELREKMAVVGVKDLNAVRGLVLEDQYSFASAAWFLATQCGDGVRGQLQTGSKAGWEKYISECVGTEPGPREAYWQAAIKALG